MIFVSSCLWRLQTNTCFHNDLLSMIFYKEARINFSLKKSRPCRDPPCVIQECQWPQFMRSWYQHGEIAWIIYEWWDFPLVTCRINTQITIVRVFFLMFECLTYSYTTCLPHYWPEMTCSGHTSTLVPVDNSGCIQVKLASKHSTYIMYVGRMSC